MDQRVKGGAPANAILDPSPELEDSAQDGPAEKRRRVDVENGEVQSTDQEQQGTGKKREGHKAAVLELLIEGRCGSTGQQPLQITGRETNCPEGNLRLRIGLQAKRTKKPPKSLESYVCKPTIRTYQRQGRGGPLRGEGEGQQSKTSSVPTEANRENHSVLDGVQTTSKQAASAASTTLASLSPSSSSQLRSSVSSCTTASSPTSVSASQGTKPAKKAPLSPADNAEENSNGSTQKVKKEKPATVNGQAPPAGLKLGSSSADQTPSSAIACTQRTSATEGGNDGETSENRSSLAQTKRQNRQSNSKGSAPELVVPSSPNGVSSKGSPSRTSNPSNCHKEHTLSKKRKTVSPDSPSPEADPTMEHSSVQSRNQEIPTDSSTERIRDKERKLKKDKKREKKSKQDRSESEMTRDDGDEDGKKKRKERGKDDKSRKEKDKRKKTDVTHEEQNFERDKKRDKNSTEAPRKEDNNANVGEVIERSKQDQISNTMSSHESEEEDGADDDCTPVSETKPATGDANKSKDLDISKHSTAPPTLHSSSPSPPTAPISPPSSSQEQDSRPLKKRKARRPSWTKLVQRAQRTENLEPSSELVNNPSNPKTPLSVKASVRQPDESPKSSSSFFSGTSLPPSSANKPSSPKLNLPLSADPPPINKFPQSPNRKRGRPKSYTLNSDEPLLKKSTAEFPPPASRGASEANGLESSSVLDKDAECNFNLKRRGRPSKHSLFVEQTKNAFNQTKGEDGSKHFHSAEKGNRQMKIKRMLNEMKKRKKRRLKVLETKKQGKQGGGTFQETALKSCQSIGSTSVHTLSSLTSSFGGKLGPQINVSKRGTIYMGKRRGRKPKAQTVFQNSKLQTQNKSMFTHPSETSLFSYNQSHPAPSHPFPSPSLTHSSGAQSPYSEGSVAEQTSSLLFPHPFFLPSPTSSCTSPRPPSTASLSPFVKKSCPCQGRHNFPFHQSSCKLSCLTPPLHNTPSSPGHLKEATPSPRSESQSEETLPSDSGIGTDNNSISERVEMRGARGILRLGQTSGMMNGSQKHLPLLDHSSIASPRSLIPRHINPISNTVSAERHRERHRHKRKDYNCAPSYACLCSCSGNSKCTHSDYYACLGHSGLKRQKNKHKKKHQQLHMHDPDFLSELEDLIGLLSEIHIGKRTWGRMGLGQGFDTSGNAPGGRRHVSSSHHRSNIFRINLNGFYSPHPSTYPSNAPYTHQPFYPCQPLHCNRKSDRRQCGCPSKFQDSIENVGFYSSYPQLYHHLPNSYPLTAPHQYAPHQPHHAHFLINPARFRRRRGRLLREGTLGGEMEGEFGGSSFGGPHLSSGYTSCLPRGFSRSDHKHKHRHRQCEQVEGEELPEDEEEDDVDRDNFQSSKPKSRFILGEGRSVRKGTKGLKSMPSKESPWLREKRTEYFSPAASSSTPSAERFKHTSLTSLGLGSTHLSSFGGGWGGLGQSWAKLGSSGFGGFRSFTGERNTSRTPDGESREETLHLSKATESPTHTNLFASAATATEVSGFRPGLSSRNQGSGDKSRRSEEPSWTERREAGLQGDLRSRGLQKCAPKSDHVTANSKRSRGRPRKNLVPSTSSSPWHSSQTTSPISSPDNVPTSSLKRDGRVVAGRRGERWREERDWEAGNTRQSVTELCAAKKKVRKTKHDAPPFLQSTVC
ncbi:histone-lysine N-methyltransferase ASH1L-like isoform X2 [Synchiropus splendidus]|uniref:histone-lysine N-methyltransferase ASH1L-like isoform X2 n=1 Tax=Synchiropus splendidus TaxID=270530 RepID=UPI00237E4B62|nr:histone-lysine N-methyltransferase ASH1L-like isoform X2 [Synchiropus splendidus]